MAFVSLTNGRQETAILARAIIRASVDLDKFVVAVTDCNGHPTTITYANEEDTKRKYLEITEAMNLWARK